MISFILEIVFEIVIEGALEVAGSKRVPMWIRILLASVFVMIVGGLISIILCLGIVVGMKDSIIGGVFLFLIGLFLAFMMIYRIFCIYRDHKEDRILSL